MAKEEKKAPKLRFNGYTNDWERKKLGDVANSYINGGTPDTQNKNYWIGDIPWIESSDLKNDDIWNVNINKYITNKAVNDSAAKLIPANSIAIVTRVGVGMLLLGNPTLFLVVFPGYCAVTATFELPVAVQALRFDPGELPCCITNLIFSDDRIICVPTNGLNLSGGGTCFWAMTPTTGWRAPPTTPPG